MTDQQPVRSVVIIKVEMSFVSSVEPLNVVSLAIMVFVTVLLVKIFGFCKSVLFVVHQSE